LISKLELLSALTTSCMALDKPETYPYARDRSLDIFQPSATPARPRTDRAGIVFLHGGGLVAGTRAQLQEPWRRWLIGARARGSRPDSARLTRRADRASEDNVVLFSAQYSLLPQCTGFDMIRDMRDLFAHLAAESSRYGIDPARIGFLGSSAGCYVAQLAALHVTTPYRPRALGLNWGMGTCLALDTWLTPTPEPVGFFQRTPASHILRVLLAKGTLLDALTGREGFSDDVRRCATADERRAAVPEDLRAVFPELALRTVARWPPTAIVHGRADTAVPFEESEILAESLRARGDVEVQCELLDGGEHGLEGAEGSQEARERVYAFVIRHLA
jgi:acetyl esterase/lipase